MDLQPLINSMRIQRANRVVCRGVVAFIELPSMYRWQAASRQLNEAMRVSVDLELKNKLIDCRPIVREMAYRPLELLAFQGSSEAVNMIVAIANSDDESQELRKWAIEGVWRLATKWARERWATHVLLSKGGPLQSSNWLVRHKAIAILTKLCKKQSWPSAVTKPVSDELLVSLQEYAQNAALSRYSNPMRLGKCPLRPVKFCSNRPNRTVEQS
jgi:hypothetical protein